MAKLANIHVDKSVISDDYKITDKVLGLGINGKVLECYHRKTWNKYALKVSERKLVLFQNTSKK